MASSGPTVVDAKTNPGTFELSSDFKPTQTATIVADVKDFTAKVTDVNLRFLHVPMEIPMQNIGGTTWRAQLSSEQLKTLAVGGQTIKYDVNVVAKDEDGMTAVSKEPINIAVKAPDLSKPVQQGSG